MLKTQLPYRKIQIKKSSNEYRNIYIPSEQYKEFLQSLVPILNEIYLKNRVYDCDHAFLPKRNCVSNAILHVHNRYVLSLDINNFFETIRKNILLKYIPESILNFMLIDDVVVQGFPTSPYLANISMIDFDFQITMALRQISEKIVYSRYADDLTISSNDEIYFDEIILLITKCLQQNGLALNTRKTLLQDKHKGRAIITGIGVSEGNIHPTRKTLKKMRAAQHQKNWWSYKGLQEWSQCKLPKL